MRLIVRAEPGAESVCATRGRWRRIVRATLYAKLVLVSLVAIVAAVGFLRLAAGPVSLQSYSDRLAHALADQLGQGWSVALADTALELNGSKPAVRTRELEIRNPAGLLVVRAPDAIVSLDPTSLLWGGLLPREIELRDLELRAAIAADGSLSFLPPPDAGGATPGPAPQPVPPPPGPAKPPLVAPGASPIAAAVASLLAPVLDDTGLIAAIDKARVVGARLSLVGADGRERVAFRNVGAEFEHREGGQRSITLDMAGQHGAWRLEGLVGEVDGRRSADLEVTSVPAEDILLLSGLSTLPAGSDVKVSAAVSATMEAGQLTRLSGSFDTAAGIVHQTGAPPVRLDQLAGRAIWHEDSREVELKDLAIVSGGTSVRVDGRLAAIEDGAWRLQLAGRDARFDGAAAGDPAFTLAELSTDMVFRDAAVSIERVVVKGDGIDARLWGGSRPDPRGPALTARIEADRSDLRKLLRLWPDTLNPDLRTYLVKNLTAGTVDQLRLAIDADPDDVRAMTSNRPLRDQALTATFSLSDAKLQVVDGLPPLKRLEAEGRTTGTRIALTGRQGRIDLPEGRRINFSEASYDQSGLDKPGSIARIAFKLDGGADAFAAFLGQPMFKDVAHVDLDPAAIKGRGELRVSLPLDPGKVPKPADMQVTIAGALTDVSVEKVFGRDRLDGANLAVSYEGGSLSLKGEGKIGGSPATIDLRQPRGTAGEVLVGLTLDEAARSRRALPSAPQVTGPVAVKFTVPLGPPKPFIKAEADLTRASIDGLLPGWSKPAGRPARLAFTSHEADGTELRDVQLESGPVQLRGSANFSTEGALDKADLSTVKLSPGDDLRAQLERRDGVYRLALRGQVADARPVLKWVTAPAGGGGSGKATGKEPPDLDLDLQVAILTGHNDEAMTGVTARVSTRGREIRSMQTRGQFRSAPFEARVTKRDGDAPVIVAQSGDAGAALRFLDLYKRMIGGNLQVQSTLGDTSQVGTIRIDAFGLRNEPALRRIVSSTPPQLSEDRSGPAIPRLDGDVVAFTRLTAGFARTGSRVDYKDVVIFGSQVGFNLSGNVDYGRDQLDVSGTFVPAYGLNNAFSQVPVVGVLLGGGKTEGLFAIDFRVSGSAASPSIAVNPLTVVAPGILRKLFGWMLPGAEEPAVTASPRGTRRVPAPPSAPREDD